MTGSPHGGEGSQKSILWPAREVQSKRLAAGQPGVDGKPARRGRFSEITIGARILPIFKTRARKLRPGVAGKPARRGRFSEITIGAGISPIFKARARRRRPGVGGKPARMGRPGLCYWYLVTDVHPWVSFGEVGSPGGGEQAPPAVLFFQNRDPFFKTRGHGPGAMGPGPGGQKWAMWSLVGP